MVITGGWSMTLLMLLLVAADPSGRFDNEGHRLEAVREAVKLTPEQEVDFRTIAEWEKLATTARSKHRRAEGARVAMRICLNRHKILLTEPETAAAHKVVVVSLA